MIVALFLLAAVAAIGDMLTTAKIIRNGGREVIPWNAALIDKLGLWPAMLLIKGLSFAAVIGLLMLAKPSPYLWIIPALLLAGNLYALLHNLRALKH